MYAFRRTSSLQYGTVAGKKLDAGNVKEEYIMDKRSEILNQGLKGFIVTCAECGKKAVGFGRLKKIGGFMDEVFQSEADRNPFLFQGITGSQAIPREHVTSVVSLLKVGDLRDLNNYMTANCKFTKGIDAYCYQCNLVYCHEHYKTYVIYAHDYPGWYESTEGTCPQGHIRSIDD